MGFWLGPQKIFTKYGTLLLLSYTGASYLTTVFYCNVYRKVK